MAYLILAHEHPAQLERLIDTLLREDTDDFAVVHADRRSALWRTLQDRLPGPPDRVHLVADPEAVRWGHWSQVAATGLLIERAVQIGCDYAHLISGADWPAISRDALTAQLGAGLCHIEARPNYMEERMQGFRFDTRWLRLDPGQDRTAYAMTWELRRIARWVASARARFGSARSRPFGPWIFGATWWSLPADVLGRLTCEVPALLRSGRLKGTVCSDEYAIPTLVARFFPERLADNRRFIRFPPGESSPRLLGREDLPAIAESGAWFVRKVALEHDPFFLELAGAVPRRQAAVGEKP